MSDFLTNLVARTMASPTLRPRLRARFEPPAEEPAAAMPEGEAAPPRATPRSAATEVPVHVIREAASPPQAVAEERENVAETPPAAPVAPRREEAVPVERAVHAQPPQIEQRETPIPPPRPTSVAVPEPRDEEETPQAAETIITHRHRFDLEPPRVERRVEMRHSVERESVFRERTVRVSSLRREIAAAADAAAPTEPVVHVSIGRVEVRAVAPQPQSRRAAPRAAALTLDDYVARRDRKERR